jgi:hypothetical protein
MIKVDETSNDKRKQRDTVNENEDDLARNLFIIHKDQGLAKFKF